MGPVDLQLYALHTAASSELSFTLDELKDEKSICGGFEGFQIILYTSVVYKCVWCAVFYYNHGDLDN